MLRLQKGHAMKNLLASLVPAALLVGTPVSKEAVSTKDAPSAAGAYSQAIKAGGFVFAAGQIARDPATNKVVEGDVKAQTERVLKNLSAILTAAGTSMDRAVKTSPRGDCGCPFARQELFRNRSAHGPPRAVPILISAGTSTANRPCRRPPPCAADRWDVRSSEASHEARRAMLWGTGQRSLRGAKDMAKAMRTSQVLTTVAGRCRMMAPRARSF